MSLNVSVPEVPSIRELKAAIPAQCFQPSIWKSISYFLFDICLIAGLFALALYLDSWYFYPVYWFLQGTMFWALFVVGHDCGHGSFSHSKRLNSFIGHLAHTPILVPYHGWRISHRTHHQNTGNIEKDETWYPVTESQYRNMPRYIKFLRFYAFLVLFPLYLFRRSPGKDGSHFHPASDLFLPSEKWDVLTSSLSWFAFFGLLCAASWWFGIAAVAKFYIAPYFVFVVWLDLVTFLHHTSEDIPWYRGEGWNFVRGNLSSVDRSYGIFEWLHHNIGTHAVHHLFIAIPHYRLKEAAAALKPVLGPLYRTSNESILKAFWNAFRKCHFVPDHGTMVYYKPSSALSHEEKLGALDAAKALTRALETE
ncbi:MAG: fatty acid desaturase [Leptospirales bacterium]|nr:fatty acid desaturase [Leptospirales bacterium]